MADRITMTLSETVNALVIRGARRFAFSEIFAFRRLALSVVLIILAVLVIIPLFFMILASFRPAGVLPTDVGPYTISAYVQAFAGPDSWPVIRNTLLYAGLGVVFALPLAFGLAFLTERSDMPGRQAVYVLMFVPMSTPIFATAVGWVLLLGPRGGIINVYLRLLLGSNSESGPFNIFTFPGLVFVHVLGLVPTMWLFLTAVLRQMDASLEDAASISGASRRQILTRVTAPLMRPGIAAVMIYFFLTGLESLELPLVIGPTAGIDLLSTKIYFTLVPSGDLGVNYGVPAAFGMLGLAMGICGILVYLRMVRQASRYAVVTGKGYRPRPNELGRWKYVALALVALFVLVKVVLPFCVLIYASFLRFYIPPTRAFLGHMPWTLQNYDELLDYRFFGKFFVNTMIVSLGAATTTMLLVSFIAWLVVRRPGPLSTLINSVAFTPLAVPGIISTLALFLMFVGTPLEGTLVLLILAFITRYLAFGTRLMHATILQIHHELEEAAETSGATGLQAFFRITLRLVLPAILNGWLWVFVHAAKDFSVALFLASAASVVAANIIYQDFTSGRFNDAAAALVFLVAFNSLFVITGRKWITRAAESGR